MPPRDVILASLTAIANDWRPLAIMWHLYAAATLVLLTLRPRVSPRIIAMLLVPMVTSVAVLAWATANPFSGIVFAAAAVALTIDAVRISPGVLDAESGMVVVLGAVLVATGVLYPHFIVVDRWTEYTYSAPLGLIPCPTLCFAIGVGLIAGLARKRAWTAIFASLATIYGLIGALRLGVAIDVMLLGASALLVGLAAVSRRPTAVT